MKRKLLFTTMTLAGILCLASPASADHGRGRFDFGFGVGFGGGGIHLNYNRGHYRSFDGCVPHVHVHHRVPVYARVWVPPVYQTVFVGYDVCGFPVYRQVLVSAGCYRTHISYYRCGGCGQGC